MERRTVSPARQIYFLRPPPRAPHGSGWARWLCRFPCTIHSAHSRKSACLDQISRGRLDVGIGTSGVPMEHRYFGISPTEADARYHEAVEILLTRDGGGRADTRYGVAMTCGRPRADQRDRRCDRGWHLPARAVDAAGRAVARPYRGKRRRERYLRAYRIRQSSH